VREWRLEYNADDAGERLLLCWKGANGAPTR
jgi:hypothetical protein